MKEGVGFIGPVEEWGMRLREIIRDSFLGVQHGRVTVLEVEPSELWEFICLWDGVSRCRQIIVVDDRYNKYPCKAVHGPEAPKEHLMKKVRKITDE